MSTESIADPKHELSHVWNSIQRSLFPQLEEALGPLTESLYKVITTLEVVRIEDHIKAPWWMLGRPQKSRVAIARALVAKAVLNLDTTRALIDRLKVDAPLRRVCGFERKNEIPSESVFSRAFAEFASLQLPQRAHEAMIQKTQKDRIVGHISRDATAIEARERPKKNTAAEKPKKAKRSRGRP